MADSQESIKEQVLKREIPWETYMTAKMIQGTDLMLLRRYDHRGPEVQSQLLNQDGAAYFKTFLAVLKNVSKEETTEYVLTLLDEALQAVPSRAALFHDKTLAADDIYGPFLRCLTRKNWFTQERATRILTLIISSRPRGGGVTYGTSTNGASTSAAATAPFDSLDPIVSPFMDFLCAQLKSPSHPSRSVPTAISALAALLRERSYRPLLVKADGVKLLAPHIVPPSGQQHVQLVYEAVLAVWLLTFYEPAQAAIHAARIIPKLIDVAKSGAKEKVVRVAVLSLKNLFDKFGSDMIEHGLLKVVVILQLQSWSDEDLSAALQALEESAKSNIKVLSSFEQYKAEVLSGNLDWTPMHKDASFWREYIGKFEENDFQTLRVLITLLESSNDSRTLAVACHDLGQFIQYHPAGRGVALDLKAKEKVMGRMTHPDPEVQKQALLCIQKLLLSAKYTSYLQT